MEKAMFAQICRLCFDLIPFLKRKKLAGSSVLEIMRNQQKKKSNAHKGKLVMQ